MEFLFALFLPLLAAAQGNVVTCGGFVEASAALLKALPSQKFDYSFVQMHLYTAEGLLKYTAECAPNGYYFIPVYDNGRYQLHIEGPNGWTFEPKQFEFVVSESENGCADDFNFHFTGFMLRGRVTGAAASDCDSSSSPSGVHLSLLSESGSPIDTALSDDKGNFVFNNVFLGKYLIHAAHPQWSIEPTQQIITIEFGQSELKTPFRVTGYQLTGAVSAIGEAMADIDFFLFVDNSVDTHVDCSLDSALTPPRLEGHRLLCHTQSNEQGAFAFSQLPCGHYTLIPSYQKSAAKYDIEPSQLSVSISHDSIHLLQQFQVLGFTVRGKVIDLNKKPLSGVEVVMDGERRVVTDANGVYMLDRVKAGKHSVIASSPHYEFTELTNVLLSPSSAEFPPITIARYDLCGSADVDDPIVIELFDSQHKLVQSITTDENGAFCVSVTPNNYQLKPKGQLVLSPPEYDVIKGNEPVLDIRFLQTRVSVTGSVKLTHGRHEQFASLNEKDEFSFTDVRPGKYVLSVEHDWWCWQSKSIDLQLLYDDVNGIAFTHTGFALKADFSHPSSIELGLVGSNDTSTVAMNAGPNRLCVGKAGKYQLTPRGCTQFSQARFFFDTANPEPLTVRASKFLAEGYVLVEGEKVNTVSVHVESTLQEEDVEAVAVEVDSSLLKQLIKETKSKSNDLTVLKYSFWANPSSSYTLLPSSRILLFYPRQHSYKHKAAACPGATPAFLAKKGLFLSGAVTPPINNVHITVSTATQKAIVSVLTDATGGYRVGPFYDDQQYSVTAHADGFVLVESTPGNFKAMQLSQLTVKVKDEADHFLSDVLLSLSGKGYRNNNATGADGSFVFTDLFPGAYYLKPTYKEYVFTPKFKSIDISEAVQSTHVFVATRVAYSVFGVVKSLNGEPQSQVFVEAIDATSDQIVEDTQTDAGGAYRIRGLPPNKEYAIQIKQSNEQLERASPASVRVAMKADDVTGVNFVAFRQLNKFDLNGFVNASDAVLPTLRVDLVRAASQFTVLKSAVLSKAFPFFEFHALPADDYIVKVRTSLSPLTHHFDAESAQARVSLRQHSYTQLRFEATEKVVHQEFSRSSLGSVMLATAVILVVIYRTAIVDFLRDLIGSNASVDDGKKKKRKR